MIKRFICAVLVLALAGSLWLVAYSSDDPMYSNNVDDKTVSAEGEAEDEAAFVDDGSLTLWYTDESLTDYLTSVALSFQQDQGIKVNIVLKDGVMFLESINDSSLQDPSDRTEPMPDMYITSHDNLLKAYLAGLASQISDPAQVVTEEMYPLTSINAVTCYDHLVAYPLYYETNFFLYNKTYMASIAQNRIEAEADLAEGEEATRELEENGSPDEAPEEIEADAVDEAAEDYDSSNPMGEEDSTADQEVLERLATMIPQTIEDIKMRPKRWNPFSSGMLPISFTIISL